VLEAQEAGGSVFGLAGHRRRFNDKYVDEIGGLGYYGASYYDNVLIGWTQADPKYRVAPDAAWSEPRRAMLYSFVMGNPMRYVDPDGRDSAPTDGDSRPGEECNFPTCGDHIPNGPWQRPESETEKANKAEVDEQIEQLLQAIGYDGPNAVGAIHIAHSACGGCSLERANDTQKRKILSTLRFALRVSPAFRAELSKMMQAGKESWIVQTDRGRSQTSPWSRTHAADSHFNGTGVGFAAYIVDAAEETTNPSEFQSIGRAANSPDSTIVHELFHGVEIMMGRSSPYFQQTARESEERALGFTKKRVAYSVTENEYYGYWHPMRVSY